MDKFYWITPQYGHGFYLLPTIQIWRTDFKKMGIMPFVSWGFVLHIFRWHTGFAIHIK